MWTRLLRGFAAVLLVSSFSLPFAVGQDDKIERGVKLDSSSDSEKGSSGPSALPYFVMAIYSMLVLTIVCMPSRKA